MFGREDAASPTCQVFKMSSNTMPKACNPAEMRSASSNRLSVKNYEMRTQVASIAFGEIPKNSELAEFYQHPILRLLVSTVVGKEEIYPPDDSLGCCSINVFRPGYHHSFHFDES